MGARNRVGIGLSYRPARLNRLAELIPWYQFLGSLKFKNSGSGFYIHNCGDSSTHIRTVVKYKISYKQRCGTGIGTVTI
jgi:hypothetical protein